MACNADKLANASCNNATEEADAKKLAALIEGVGREALALPGDIVNEAWCREMVVKTVAEFGDLGILVINAGHQQRRESIEKITSKGFDVIMKTDLCAMCGITQEAVPHLSSGAAAITTASVQAFDPSGTLLGYATAKAGAAAHAKALSEHLLQRGIRANVVAPGPFWTALQASGGQPPETVAQFGAPGPASPIHVLLASQDGGYMTGKVYGATRGEGAA